MFNLGGRWEIAADKRDKLWQAYEQVKDQSGDLAEFGVFEGGNTRAMAEFAPDRVVWAFDTFEGMPQEDWRGETSDLPGKWKPKAPPEELFKDHLNVQVMKGRFIRTIPQLPAGVQFVLVNIDCDWGDSYAAALGCITPRLAPHAMIFLDEYGLDPVRPVVDAWLRAHPEATLLDGERIEWRS